MTNDNKPKLERGQEVEEAIEVSLYTFTGKHLDLLTLKEEDVDLEDIAHSLAMQCRYNGHVREFYSVAEHSVLLAQYVLNHPQHGKASYTKQLAQIMLLHDGSEAYIGDMVYHLKKTMYAFEVLEEFILEKIRLRFGVQKEYIILEQLVNAIDRSASVDEMELLHPGGVDPVLYDMGCKALGLEIKNWTPKEAKAEFLAMAAKLNIK